MKLRLKDSVSTEEQYESYIQTHKDAVKKAFEWIAQNIPEVLEGMEDAAVACVLDHDASKYSAEEFHPYAEYFYGERTPAVEAAFNAAWLHHIHENPHHWQHWVLIQDEDADLCVEIPPKYIIEMVCDHWAFSWVKGNLNEIFSWYESHKAKIKMNERSKALYESILRKIKEKL